MTDPTSYHTTETITFMYIFLKIQIFIPHSFFSFFWLNLNTLSQEHSPSYVASIEKEPLEKEPWKLEKGILRARDTKFTVSLQLTSLNTASKFGKDQIWDICVISPGKCSLAAGLGKRK